MEFEGEDYIMETQRDKLIPCVALGKAYHTLGLSFSICKMLVLVQISGSQSWLSTETT